MNQPANLITRITRHSVFRFLLIGGLAFLIDAGLLWALHQLLLWPLWLASGVAFLIGFVFSYTLQRAFSFGSDVPHGQGLFRYMVVLGFNTLATMLIVQLLGSTPLGWVGAKVTATVVTTIWNYFLYRWWVFPAPGTDPSR